MQPYFFPYIGYWQLMNQVDRFVVYDDVNYIKRGWINRNRILVNGEPLFLTIPVSKASQNKRICDLCIDQSVNLRGKMLKSIDGAYRRAPHFPDVFPLLESVIRFDATNLSDFLLGQIKMLAKCLGIGASFVDSSRVYANDQLAGQDRILNICIQENCTTYINLSGGRSLYDKKLFSNRGVELKFLEAGDVRYLQNTPEFHANLSIVDILMSLGREGTREALTDCVLD